MKTKGISISKGLSIGVALKIEDILVDIKEKNTTNPKKEVSKFLKSLNSLKEELSKDLEKLADKETKEIIETHIAILGDNVYLEEIKQDIIKNKHTAAYSLYLVTNSYIQQFESLDNPYLLERKNDLEELYIQLVSRILDINTNIIFKSEPTILVVESLKISLLKTLKNKNITGIVSKNGSLLSHASIIARNLKVPVIVGIDINGIYDNDKIILDGDKAEIIINPSIDDIFNFNNKLEKKKQIDKEIEELDFKNLYTKDGKKINLGLNINDHFEVNLLPKDRYQQIGLYRTEFLYLNDKKKPSLLKQTQVYEKILSFTPNNKVVVRTLDIGGDKKVAYLKIKKQPNPFLGIRGIRYSLLEEKTFKTQIKALLMANKHSNLHILLPMITSIDELIWAKRIINEVKQELERKQKVNYFRLGIMVEVPITLLSIEQYLTEIDFISIGTNDLLQYLFAIDRVNNTLNYLYQPYNPYFLKLLYDLVNKAHKRGISVSICGEIANDEKLSLLLFAMGVDLLSMRSASYGQIAYNLSKFSHKSLYKLLNQVLKKNTNDEVKKLLEKFIKGEE